MNINPYEDPDYLKWRLSRGEKRNRKGQTYTEVLEEFHEALEDFKLALKHAFINLLKALKVMK